MEGLMKLLVDPNERQGYAWMRMRIKRIWSRWKLAINSLNKKQDLTHRKPKKVDFDILIWGLYRIHAVHPSVDISIEHYF